MPLQYNSPQELHFDLVVTGGGLAGLCAAIAAARQGSKTALIQDRPMPGGNCSSEIRVVPHGSNHSNAWAQETGLPHAMILEDRFSNHEHFLDHGMINSRFDLTLMEFARNEKNLTVFYNSTVRGVDSEALEEDRPAQATANGLGLTGGGARRIRALHAGQLGSEKEFVFRAPQFIDATGDGTIGFLAGADFRYGREARAEFNEPLAPLVSDDVTMGSTITLRARDTGKPVEFRPPPWIEDYRSMDAIGFNRTLYHLEEPVYGGFWWMEICNPFHQIEDNQAIRDELHRHVVGVWNYIKNHSPHREKAARYALDWIGMIPGKRESRRLMGDVVLSEGDCHEDRQWPDAVAFAGWWIDLHIKGGLLNKVDPGERENADRNYKHWIRIPLFTLPLRSFYSRNVQNLWMAGRCLSCTHVALGPSRVMQTLGMMGHAVGIAAAYAIKNNLTPRETADPSDTHLSKLRQILLRDDVRIPGLANTDPLDLALKARTLASSRAPLDFGDARTHSWSGLGNSPGETDRSPEALSMVVPLTGNRLEEVFCYLKNWQATPATLIGGLQRLKTIWDRPDQPLDQRQVLEIPGSFEGWFRIPFAADIENGRPYRISLRLEGSGALGWAHGTQQPPGTVIQYLYICPGGPEAKNAALPGYQPDEVLIPAYRHWRQNPQGSLALRLSPQPDLFGGENVNNGKAWPESGPNLWISDPALALPQHVDLLWDQASSFNCAEISFDTNLSRITQHESAFFAAPECARDWALWACCDGTWTKIHTDHGNYQRKRRVRFDRVQATALRLEIIATHGSPEARVYEIRVYNEED